ncbi:hypothetical protein A3B61_04875 [Candidatus Peribacteria bacterium RIFCSPLOWO2_01_FULL_53_10]|nr:MAG: hypothetical protein A3B61_04875 [Candidatus Peribacteria bacterium RIFCSPLOWO2_01_FULL_53_10]
MQSRCVASRHFLVLKRGEEICETINAYVREKNICAGSISGIGAANLVTLRFYDVKKKEYFSKTFEGEYEIATLLGNISLMDGKPWAHLHITIGDREYHAFAGHLHSARVGVTCEVIIDAANTEIGRVRDEEMGLKVWDLGT